MSISSEFALITLFFCFIFLLEGVKPVRCDSEEADSEQRYQIDGKVVIPSNVDQDWVSTTRVLVDGGQYFGFLRWAEHVRRYSPLTVTCVLSNTEWRQVAN